MKGLYSMIVSVVFLIKRGSLLLFFGTLSCALLAQTPVPVIETPGDLLNYADGVYGSDDKLVNGRIYVPAHSLAEGHPYFYADDWIRSDVYIKGTAYPEEKLKYDLELDEFVLFFTDRNEKNNYIVLNRHYIDSIQMGKYLFVNSGVMANIDDALGYVELVYRDRILFLIKHKKDFKKVYSETKPYGEYNKETAVRYISESGILSRVNTKKALLNYFEPHKREIKRFMKKNKIKYKKANSGELYQLLKYCNEVRNS